jgi:hypothetical protein
MIATSMVESMGCGKEKASWFPPRMVFTKQFTVEWSAHTPTTMMSNKYRITMSRVIQDIWGSAQGESGGGRAGGLRLQQLLKMQHKSTSTPTP